MKNQNQNLSKKLVITLAMMMMLLISITNSSWAQIPATMSYQGCLKNNNGDPQTGTFNLLFKIYESESGVTEIWSENHIGVHVDNGYFDVILGGLDQIPFTKQYWLGISVNGEQELTPRSKLTSVPYSLNTKSIPDLVVTTSKIADNAVTAAKISPNVISSIDGISNDGGNIDLVPGSNIQISPDDQNNSITISASGGGGENLAQTLANGNSAGSYNIDMDSDDIINVDDIHMVGGVNSRIEMKEAARIIFYNVAGSVEGEIRSSSEGNYDQLEFWTDTGWFAWKDEDGNFVAQLEGISGSSNNGDFWVLGDISCDGIKSFNQDHPEDPSKEIVYVCLEGGEAGTYTRGTAELNNGEAIIILPKHFELVTSNNGITAQITPRENCNGIYVVSVNTKQLIVKELMNGKSDAKFDYFIQGVRRGYDDFDVIREKTIRKDKSIEN